MSRPSRVSFFDCFAGIGGIRLGLERAGMRCVGSCEIDPLRREVYESNFKTDGEFYQADVRALKPSDLPRFDILTGGFPCQSFSRAGRGLGMEDPRGKLFLDLVRILRATVPKSFLFENVQGLTLMRREFSFVIGKLCALGYRVKWSILNSKDFGLPQNRPRVFIVGFRKRNGFEFPKGMDGFAVVKDIMERKVERKYYLADAHVRSARLALPSGWRARRNGIVNVGNQFPSDFETGDIHSPFGICRCLVPSNESVINAPLIMTRWPKRGPPTIRHLTPRECARLQGFPEGFRIHANDRVSYRQLGDSVSVPVIEAIGREMGKCLTR